MTQSNTRSKKRINRRKTKRINRGGNNQNHYETLGVKPDANIKEIKEAYHKLARIYDTNKNPNDLDVLAMSQKINEAKGILLDTDQRKEYDLTITPDNAQGVVVVSNKQDSSKTVGCSKTNKEIFDAFVNDLHESYFKPGENESEPDPNYGIQKTHHIKIKSFPSSFSSEKNPVHFYSKLTDNVSYNSVWEQFVMDAWGIDDMINLVNLQQYSHDPYKGDDNETEERDACAGMDLNKKNKDEDYDEDMQKKIDKCKTYQSYKKYKYLSNLKDNTIKDFIFEDNYKIHKIMNPPKKNKSNKTK